MDLSNFNYRMDELLVELTKRIKSEAKHKLNSGAINMVRFSNDSTLPKIVLCSVLYDMANEYKKFTKEFKDEVNNLNKF